MNIQHTMEPTAFLDPDAWRDDWRRARDFAARCWVGAMRRMQASPARSDNRCIASE